MTSKQEFYPDELFHRVVVCFGRCFLQKTHYRSFVSRRNFSKSRSKRKAPATSSRRGAVPPWPGKPLPRTTPGGWGRAGGWGGSRSSTPIGWTTRRIPTTPSGASTGAPARFRSSTIVRGTSRASRWTRSLSLPVGRISDCDSVVQLCTIS